MIPILEIKNISKKFRIRHEQQPYLSLRDSVTNFFKSPLSTWRGAGGEVEDFWALKDISFDVYPGESIGIIGKNGAGKSTLLKILSKITPPTAGKIISRGRIASLLEVGTGFHHELSGRENIFLNGSILGMKRKEILAKFDEIVDFSGVEKFLDTPLKHYSSGMQLRLAFAVAAFLEPEILVIDEVLAVGDAEFQRKCLGKMREVSNSGRTILFVSHNMGAVQNLCQNAILIDKGSIKISDKSNNVINKYTSALKIVSEKKREYIISNDGTFKLKLPYWVDSQGNKVYTYNFGENYILRFEFDFFNTPKPIYPGMALLSKDGSRLFTSHLKDDNQCNIPKNIANKFIVETELNLPTIAPGYYQVIFGVADDKGNTVIGPENETEVILIINETNSIKDGAHGILWHTGNWRCIIPQTNIYAQQ